TSDEALPGFMAGLVMFTADPALDDAREQALEGGTVVFRIAQDVEGIWLTRQHGGQQTADDRFGIEFIETGVQFQFRCRQTRRNAALQGGSGGMLLATQGAAEATIKTQTEVRQVL